MIVIFPVNELRTQMAVIVRSDNFKICVIIGINAPIANRLKTTPTPSIMAYSSENVSVPIKNKLPILYQICKWYYDFQK